MSESSSSHPLALRVATELGRGDLGLERPPPAASAALAVDPTDARAARELAEVVTRDERAAQDFERSARAWTARPWGASIEELCAALEPGLARALVFACCAARSAFESPRAYLHGRLAAELALEVGQVLGLPADDAFLCGLLHDVGRPLVRRAVARLAEEAGVRLSPDELTVVADALHADAGGAALDAWGLPPLVAAGARGHHEPVRSAPPVEPRVGAHLARVADRLAHATARGRVGVPPDAVASAWALGLAQDGLRAVWERRARARGRVRIGR